MRSFGWWALLIALGTGTLGGVGLVASHVRDARAVGTRTFDLDTQEKLSGGEQKGTAITSAGEIESGWTTSKTTLVKGTSVWSGLQLKDGSVLLGVGPDGLVLKVDAAGHESVVADTGQLAVTALVEGPGGKVYAATLPEGEIFIVDPNVSVGTNPSAPPAPKPKAWTKLASDHVWALVYDKKRNDLFAGTGPDGKIYRIDAAGRSQVHYHADDTQVVSLAISPAGTLYAGTSSKGMLLAINAAGRAEVVQDFNGHEVKAIAFAPGALAAHGALGAGAARAGETLFCIVNEYPTPPEPPKKFGLATKAPGAAVEPPRPGKGKGELWKVSSLAADGTGGKPERLAADTATHFFSVAAEPAPKPLGPVVYVGTGNDGKVVAVTESHATSVVAKVDARQIGAMGLAPGAGKGSWFATGDGAQFHRVTGVGGPDATWTSKTLDAGLKARFGKLTWHVGGTAGGVELQTRTGNTATPDDGWSGWSNPLGAPGRVTSPPGRFVQIRARWKGNAAATVRTVTLAFVTDNLRAIVTDIVTPTRPPLASSGVPASGTDVPSRSTSISLSWHSDNPDNDALRYRLWYRKDESTIWRPITKEDEPLSVTTYSWNTEALAEGWYRVRVEASDEIANPIGEALKHTLDSGPVLVDNTPPVITRIALNGGRLQAEVVDGVGPIARLEVMIDGRGGWKPLTSTDGILDEAKETVDTPLGLTGSHVVALRAYDSAGNAVTREVEGK